VCIGAESLCLLDGRAALDRSKGLLLECPRHVSIAQWQHIAIFVRLFALLANSDGGHGVYREIPAPKKLSYISKATGKAGELMLWSYVRSALREHLERSRRSRDGC
jgi:hypothetical protein